MTAGATYVPIFSVNGTGSSGIITFSSIPSTYTDLHIVINGTSTTNAACQMQFNTDTGYNYSDTYMYGDGSSAVSGRDTQSSHNFNGIFIGNIKTSNGTKSIDVMNYANTTTYKTALVRSTNPTADTTAVVGVWASTSAINQIVLTAVGNTWATGSTFTLYGIAAA
jgi:hypothetical protein